MSTTSPTGRQSVENQRGEVEFRRKLYDQQVGGADLFEDEFDSEGIEAILRERMEATHVHMRSLQARQVPLSPYIEIGAERGQRSLVMDNRLGGHGAAVDISLDMLRSCAHYRDAFDLTEMPLRVCCDANNLPFRSGSVPFVFCYETLHHFPDPTPIIAEAHRVLCPGGRLFFHEEPFKQVLRLELYTLKDKIYSENALRRGVLKRAMHRFFARKTCNEVEHGILENEDIPLRTWKAALARFAEKDVRLRSARVIETGLFGPGGRLRRGLAYLFGGEISGMCRKAEGDGEHEPAATIEDALICPACRDKTTEGKLDRTDDELACAACGRRYPVRDGVALLLVDETMRALYPEVAGARSA